MKNFCFGLLLSIGMQAQPILDELVKEFTVSDGDVVYVSSEL